MRRSRFQTARGYLIFWTLFIGVGAVAGAAVMLIDPSGRLLGMDAMLPYFQVLPFANVLFQDFVFSGMALLLVNGLSNLTAAALIFRSRRVGTVLGGIFGVTLMLWICIQFYIFPLNFMSTAYFIFGLIQAITGYAAWIFQQQARFHVAPADYPNIGKRDDRLLICFSRMGYVRKLACEAANQTGARLCEIRTKERTEGSLGFWRCGRYGMHRWPMPIEQLETDPADYSHVTICTPIWVFGMAAPIRAFCMQYAGRIREADYILCHHTPGQYQSVAMEMDRLLGLNHSPFYSVQCRVGKMKPCTGKQQTKIQKTE